jgi:RHS repeat-associated protein
MFALSLGYTTGEEKQYNGNIASMQWNTNRFGVNTYNFDYDGANRITEALFSGTGQHNTSYTYDKNGNITSLTREGRYGESSQYGGIDDLSYTYQGNQLQSVHDLNGNNTESEYYQNNGFTDNGSFATTEFTYDANGNMRTDENKNLEVANYNHLNLPQQLNLSPPQHYHEISYLYTALGQKLCKATHIDYTTATTTNYVGSFIYHDDQLQSILTPEGRVVVDGSNYEYQYFLQDHLGNTRITFNSGGIIQEDSYYPYGMNMAGLSHISGEDLPNKYRYNGKELQDDFGLGWYDYGARFYDAEIGRWHVVDPLAEDYFALSPYNYVANNPLKFIDPNGMWIDDYFNKNGRYLGSDEAKTDYVKIIDQKDWDDNKTVSSDGSESIEHATGNAISTDHSKSDITEEATLNVYDHYNPTDLEVVSHDNENGNGGLALSTTRDGGEIKQSIKIRIEGNKRTKIADNANEITNSFYHEKGHYDDIKSIGLDAYIGLPKNLREQRAVGNQMKHESFAKTRKSFQTAVKKYGIKYGMLFPIDPRPANILTK